MAQDDTSAPIGAGTGDSLGQLGRLSGWVAHEINNSLGGIHSSFALLRRLIPADHPHFRYVAAIDREIARSSALTRRLQQGYEFDPLRQGPASLASALAAAVGATEALCKSRNITLTVAHPAGVGDPPSCSATVRGAIRHLVQHAIESADGGRTITVQASYDRDQLSVVVPTCDPPRSETKSPLSGPPGFALSLVRQLAHRLEGGVIVVASTDTEGVMTLTIPTRHLVEAQ